MKCRILVADDHELVRRGMHELFDTRDDMSVCADAADGYEAIEKARQFRPHVIILDAGMPRLNGISAARRILAETPRQRIILFSAITSVSIVRLALSIGIKALVFKTDPLSDLVESVKAAYEGRTFFTGQIGQIILKGYLENGGTRSLEGETVPHDRSLTVREVEIAQLLAEGKCSKEIAVLLGVSLKTAETHRSNLMRKLHIHNLPGLVLYAIQENIIEVPVFEEAPPIKFRPAAARTYTAVAA